MRPASLAEVATRNHTGWRALRSLSVTRRRLPSAGWERERLKAEPAAAGPSQRLASRVQRKTQAARFEAGSVRLPGNVAQPHDQTEARPNSPATCRVASVSRLTTSNHGAAARPMRPPRPDWKPRAMPTRLLGTPIVVRLRTARRSSKRM